jgi:NAD(P)H dehydrogenase (quinone)
MSTPVRLAVIYYSATGFSAQIAREISDTADKEGVEVRLLKVPELAPEAAIAANDAWAAHAAAGDHVPVADPADVEWADAVIFGTPTRFGNVSSQLKQFIDTLGELWAQGKLANKVYSGFVTTATAHGGQESTLLALYNSIHHFGGIVVSPGYTDPSKYVDGNPYGTSHTVGQGQSALGEQTRHAARHQALRVIQLTAALNAGLSGRTHPRTAMPPRRPRPSS